ncbi:hypothetical protein CFAM422_008954 [Trichoderma lentiforme]|uniref:Uncharacterized protein n=1 Tax=Trichoderma lentiforme TaxID=1567552 RepID=A0A9P5CCA9_9HYPO|nr:hypothetical protein CFAM422_008954 [Trichoderma lentiforme]
MHITPLIEPSNFNKSFVSKALNKRSSDQPWSDFVITNPLLMIGVFSALEFKHFCPCPRLQVLNVEILPTGEDVNFP